MREAWQGGAPALLYLTCSFTGWAPARSPFLPGLVWQDKLTDPQPSVLIFRSLHEWKAKLILLTRQLRAQSGAVVY